jgi:aspartate racemase
MVVYYVRHSPVLMGANGVPVQPIQADPRLFEAARRLGAWADFLVITSNGVHQLREALEAAAGRPVLSMIDVTLAEVARRGWQTVGLLTYIAPTVYAQPLTRRGLRSEVLPVDLQRRLDQVIPAYMAGQTSPAATATVQEAVDTLRARGVDGIILGCSELPLLLGEASNAPDLLNPGHLLAEAAVRHAMD